MLTFFLVAMLFRLSLCSASSNGDILVTPFGRMYSDCIHYVPQGSIITETTEGVFVKHKDGSITSYDECLHELKPVDDDTTMIAADDDYFYSDGWIDFASWLASPDVNFDVATIDLFSANYSVPGTPPNAVGGQMLYWFIGLENLYNGNQTVRILQPVLAYYGFSSQNYFELPGWSFRSWNCCPSGQIFYSDAVTGFGPGDILHGEMVTYNNGESYVVTAASSNNVSTLEVSSSSAVLFDWASVTLEAYFVTSCNMFPTGPVNFTDISLSLNGSHVTPDWTPSFKSGCGQYVDVIDPENIIVSALAPSAASSVPPSEYPTMEPSAGPSFEPTLSPSEYPTMEPTAAPPTDTPSENPTQVFTDAPTLAPTEDLSEPPTIQPTFDTTTAMPTSQPSATYEPTLLASSATPSIAPTSLPTQLTSSPTVGNLPVIFNVTQLMVGVTLQFRVFGPQVAVNDEIIAATSHHFLSTISGVVSENITITGYSYPSAAEASIMAMSSFRIANWAVSSAPSSTGTADDSTDDAALYVGAADDTSSYADGVVVSYTVGASADGFTYSDSYAAYLAMAGNLTAAVQSGAYTSELAVIASQYDAEYLADAAVTSIATFTTLTAAPTAAPTPTILTVWGPWIPTTAGAFLCLVGLGLGLLLQQPCQGLWTEDKRWSRGKDEAVEAIIWSGVVLLCAGTVVVVMGLLWQNQILAAKLSGSLLSVTWLLILGRTILTVLQRFEREKIVAEYSSRAHPGDSESDTGDVSSIASYDLDEEFHADMDGELDTVRLYARERQRGGVASAQHSDVASDTSSLIWVDPDSATLISDVWRGFTRDLDGRSQGDFIAGSVMGAIGSASSSEVTPLLRRAPASLSTRTVNSSSSSSSMSSTALASSDTIRSPAEVGLSSSLSSIHRPSAGVGLGVGSVMGSGRGSATLDLTRGRLSRSGRGRGLPPLTAATVTSSSSILLPTSISVVDSNLEGAMLSSAVESLAHVTGGLDGGEQASVERPTLETGGLDGQVLTQHTHEYEGSHLRGHADAIGATGAESGEGVAGSSVWYDSHQPPADAASASPPSELSSGSDDQTTYEV